jgi:hypothetical protein
MTALKQHTQTSMGSYQPRSPLPELLGTQAMKSFLLRSRFLGKCRRSDRKSCALPLTLNCNFHVDNIGHRLIIGRSLP